MSHYAYVNPFTHIVEKVLVIDQEMIETGEFGDPRNFVSCSYTQNFPSIGYHYLTKSFNSKVKLRNCFIPPKPGPEYYFNQDSETWEFGNSELKKISIKTQVKNFLLDFFRRH